jgi:hypothetical protein
MRNKYRNSESDGIHNRDVTPNKILKHWNAIATGGNTVAKRAVDKIPTREIYEITH